MKRNKKSGSNWGLGQIIGLYSITAVLIFLGFMGALRMALSCGYEIGKLASLGDSFGVVNAFFSAMAFLVIAGSLYLQNREFTLQRQEFKIARQEQADSQEAQRTEMQLMRELQIRSNFEGRLMFLLRNLEQAMVNTRGRFTQHPHRPPNEQENYFDKIMSEISWLERKALERPDYMVMNPNYTESLFQHYNLIKERELWSQSHKSRPKDVTFFMIEMMHDRRSQQYYQGFMIFLAVIDALQKEYDAWNEAEFGTPEEIKRHFESYIYLFKSSMPHSAYVYFIYLLSLPDGKISYSRIREMLLERLHSTDYLRLEHQETLLERPQDILSK